MKKQALVLIFANGINFLVNFAMSPFLARSLSYKDNGTYGQVNLINGYLTVIFGLGITSIINLALAEHKGKEEMVVSSSFWVLLFSSFLCVLLIFLVGPFLGDIFNNKEVKDYLILFLPSTFSLNLSILFSYYYIYYGRTTQLSYLTIILNLLKVIVIYYSVNILKSLYWTFFILNVVNILSFIIQTFLIKDKIFPILKPNVDKIKYILNLGYPYLLLSVIGYSIVYTNGILISRLLGVKDFAIYRNGAIEIPFIATLYSSITAVSLPKIVEYVKEGSMGELMILKRKISSSIAVLTYPIVIFLIINGSTFIHMYLGDKYKESGLVFCLFNLAVLFRINNYSDILTVLKKPNQIILPNIYTFIFSLCMAFFMINFWGKPGAALSYSISIFFLSFLLVFNTTKALSIKFFDYFDFRKIGLIGIICLALATPCQIFIRVNVLSFLLVLTLYTMLVYFILLNKRLNLIDRSFLPEKINNLLSLIKL